MYEGMSDEGVHTLSIYAGYNQSEYYGAMGKGSTTTSEHHITFETLEELEEKLEMPQLEQLLQELA
jgi:antibiotic biosynthesis monooxygenase (ABM) superfamily enzyme